LQLITTMPAITTVHESLPYIDPEPTPEQRAAAEALIAEERAKVPDDPYHALLPPPLPPLNESRHLTPILQNELARLASSPDPQAAKMDALDFSRYEAPEMPSIDSSQSLEETASQLWETLKQAYTAQAYLSARRAHLALLDTHGKNAWLIGNWHLEGEVKAVEKELAETKREIDRVSLARQGMQEAAGAELKSLEETWKAGVGRVLETEAAAEKLRIEVLEERRRLAEAQAALAVGN